MLYFIILIQIILNHQQILLHKKWINKAQANSNTNNNVEKEKIHKAVILFADVVKVISHMLQHILM